MCNKSLYLAKFCARLSKQRNYTVAARVCARTFPAEVERRVPVRVKLSTFLADAQIKRWRISDKSPLIARPASHFLPLPSEEKKSIAGFTMLSRGRFTSESGDKFALVREQWRFPLGGGGGERMTCRGRSRSVPGPGRAASDPRPATAIHARDGLINASGGDKSFRGQSPRGAHVSHERSLRVRRHHGQPGLLEDHFLPVGLSPSLSLSQFITVQRNGSVSLDRVYPTPDPARPVSAISIPITS